jgi:large subunit ribosomal protein L22
MPGVKTNEQPGTRAVLRHFRMSATKARQVLDLIRGEDVDRAAEILALTPREAAEVVGKVLASAVANARNNDGIDPDELYVSACYADEGTTLKRWRPRARGRATRIRKRTCHITVIVSRLPEERLTRRRAAQAAAQGATRSRRVAGSRRRAAAEESTAGAPVDSAPVTDTAPVPEPVSEEHEEVREPEVGEESDTPTEDPEVTSLTEDAVDDAATDAGDEGEAAAEEKD